MSRLGGALQPGTIHLWLADCAASRDPALLARYHDLLSEGEYQRQQRYRFERDRHRDLIARALVRTCLSQYANVDPECWRFERGEHGKPQVAEPSIDLNFNLSHSHNWVACAIARKPVGVDIEYCGRPNDVLAIAERYFSATESRALFALPEHAQRERFFDYWTLKEAYMKARGEGISLGLGNFSFDLSTGETIAVGFHDSLGDDPAAWQFRLLRPEPEYRLALALREASAPITLEIFRGAPGAW